jgi:hypothetical protein
MFLRVLAVSAVVGCLALIIARPTGTVAPDPAFKTLQAPTDETIEDRVEFRLETSDLLRKYNVHVKVEKGVVTLSGDVATAGQKAEAERLAHVNGTVRVLNHHDRSRRRQERDRRIRPANKTGEHHRRVDHDQGEVVLIRRGMDVTKAVDTGTTWSLRAP